jgi:hypothetical protein
LATGIEPEMLVLRLLPIPMVAAFGGRLRQSGFLLSAYAERRVLVEGWSYTEPALGSGTIWDGTPDRSKFWDPGLLATNGDVFYYPTAANVAAFTRQYGVRWLVAVDGTPSPDPAVRRPLRVSPTWPVTPWRASGPGRSLSIGCALARRRGSALTGLVSPWRGFRLGISVCWVRMRLRVGPDRIRFAVAGFPVGISVH